MGNISYPSFGKVKTIVLPVPSDVLSVEQYKDRYGIDLKDILILDNDAKKIYVKTNACLFIRDEGGICENFSVYGLKNSIYHVSCFSIQEYVSGSAVAQLVLGIYDFVGESVVGISFTIGESDDFIFDNIQINSFGA